MKGTFVLINFDGGVLVGQNSLSFATTVTMIETSCKTTGNTSTFEAGRVAQTMSVGGLASTAKEQTNKGYWDLYAKALAGQPITVYFTEFTDKTGATVASAKEKISASCLISNLTWEAPDNDNITFSCDLQITGDVTESTNAAANTPVANAGPNQTVNEGVTVTLDGSASTNGGSGTLTYLWTAPAGITLSSTTIAQPTFTAPAQSTYTDYTFTLQVYNGTNYSLTDSVTITVLNVP